MTLTAILLVRRGGPADIVRHGRFEVAFEPGQSVLDGKVVYACTSRLEQREMWLDPLPNKPLLRDLATAIAPPDERLR